MLANKSLGDDRNGVRLPLLSCFCVFSLELGLTGRGFRIRRPFSSHDMLKSERTDRTRDTMLRAHSSVFLSPSFIDARVRSTYICGATTRLWMPKRSRTMKRRKLVVKNKWL